MTDLTATHVCDDYVLFNGVLDEPCNAIIAIGVMPMARSPAPGAMIPQYSIHVSGSTIIYKGKRYPMAYAVKRMHNEHWQLIGGDRRDPYEVNLKNDRLAFPATALDKPPSKDHITHAKDAGDRWKANEILRNKGRPRDPHRKDNTSASSSSASFESSSSSAGGTPRCAGDQLFKSDKKKRAHETGSSHPRQSKDTGNDSDDSGSPKVVRLSSKPRKTKVQSIFDFFPDGQLTKTTIKELPGSKLDAALIFFGVKDLPNSIGKKRSRLIALVTDKGLLKGRTSFGSGKGSDDSDDEVDVIIPTPLRGASTRPFSTTAATVEAPAAVNVGPTANSIQSAHLTSAPDTTSLMAQQLLEAQQANKLLLGELREMKEAMAEKARQIQPPTPAAPTINVQPGAVFIQGDLHFVVEPQVAAAAAAQAGYRRMQLQIPQPPVGTQLHPQMTLHQLQQQQLQLQLQQQQQQQQQQQFLQHGHGFMQSTNNPPAGMSQSQEIQSTIMGALAPAFGLGFAFPS